MNAKGIIPILNVSNINETVDWFKKLGWEKRWDWGSPPTFGCVYSGNVDIFLCLNGQGGRGKGTNTGTFHQEQGETADKGVWISIWVDNVDEIHQNCLNQDIEIMLYPENMPWNVRELHLRHPDGHILRVSQGLSE